MTTTVARDRFIDAVRVFAIALVVLQHWLMPVLTYSDGQLRAENSLAGPGGWAITWISQVMPLVFFAGGAAAAMSLRARRRHTAQRWVGDRVRRLAMPLVPLMIVWVPLPYLLEAVGVPAAPVQLAGSLVGALLWFLALYVGITAASPWLARLRERAGGHEVAAMAFGAVAIDVVRFGLLNGATALGYVNLVLVWGAIYQLGLHYAAGSLTRLRGARAWVLSAGGFGGVALAVLLGPYEASMIGLPGDPLSNVNPPTAVLLLLAAGQLGLALALRRVITEWSASPTVARGLDWCSARLMTVYVWHTPALVLVAGIAVVALGESTPTALSPRWWDTLPVWLGSLTLVLSTLVARFGRYELVRRPSPTGPVRTALATGLVGIGLLGLTISGFAPPPGGLLQLDSPLTWCVAIAAGLTLLHTAPPSVLGKPTVPHYERVLS